ncbi:hypothetical protein GE21DRAFT_1100047 [Neurospora crassa]|nr:hypothetical protein GE21DRAFT_1100047 [Neurospora crassa]
MTSVDHRPCRPDHDGTVHTRKGLTQEDRGRWGLPRPLLHRESSQECQFWVPSGAILGHVDINVAAGSTATIQESILKEDPEGGHGVGHRARKQHKAQPTRRHGLGHGREADMDGGIARKSVGSPMRPARYISDPSTLTSQKSNISLRACHQISPLENSPIYYPQTTTTTLPNRYQTTSTAAWDTDTTRHTTIYG